MPLQLAGLPNLTEQIMTQRYLLSAAFLMLLVSTPPAEAFGKQKPPKPVEPARQFDRAQFMLMNLNRGPGSTGGYIEESRKRTYQTVLELQKALRQLQQIEQTYVKSRGRPDDHVLPMTSEHLKQAEKTADQLLNQLRDAEKELKSEIQQAMILEP
jgi:hypothetical protein